MSTKHLIGTVAGLIIKAAVAVLVVIVVYRGATTAYDYGYRVFMEPAVSIDEGRTVTITVTKGMSPSAMGDMLYSKGLIKDPKLFVAQYWLSEYRKDIRPGTYEVTTAMTAEEIMGAMAAPDEAGGLSGKSGTGNGPAAGAAEAGEGSGGDAGAQDGEDGDPAGDDEAGGEEVGSGENAEG